MANLADGTGGGGDDYDDYDEYTDSDRSGDLDATPDDSDYDSGGGSLSVNWSAIAPGWVQDLEDVSDVLLAFGRSPAGFIIGAVLSTLLGGIQAILEAFINAFRVLFVGSDGVPSASTTGTLGLADIPLVLVSNIQAAGDPVANALITVTNDIVTAGVQLAVQGGLLAPVILAGEVAVVLVVASWVGRTLVDVGADIVPGLGGLIR
jgi:hypothetical protein